MSTNNQKSVSLFRVNGKNYLFAFILITSLFALWGFANDITNPMVKAFQKILLISHFESSLVQFAFYGGYCLTAIPAALFIRKFNYKKGLLVGLALYAVGGLLFVPACSYMTLWAFLIAYFIMTCGLSFLETTSNPYILALGPEGNATRRLNFAQAFNPMGSLTGMWIAKEYILAKLDPRDEEAREALRATNLEDFEKLQVSDLNIVSEPYLILGIVVLFVFVFFLIAKLPKLVAADSGEMSASKTFRKLLKNKRYIWSVVAQTFYVGAQIMVWTFIIQYANEELKMKAEVAQGYNIVAMVIFVSSRFICTFLLKYIKASVLLTSLAIGGGIFTLGTIFIHGMLGLYSLIAISACMSLMFPTIYGIALNGMGDEAKLASAGLILAIGGGAIFPPLQGLLMDTADWFTFLTPVRIAFFLPLICFIVIAYFGYWVYKDSKKAIVKS
jgi:FHS family L-fucose permease-like MFS transporter